MRLAIKRVFLKILCLSILFTMIPFTFNTAKAADIPTRTVPLDFNSDDFCYAGTITETDNTTVILPDEHGVYTAEGEGWTFYSEEYNGYKQNTLVLDGCYLKLNNTKQSDAICAVSLAGKGIWENTLGTVVLTPGSHNIIEIDNTGNFITGLSSGVPLIIQGDGSLDITVNGYSTCISAVNLTINSGVVNASAKDGSTVSAIDIGEILTMNSGSLTAEAIGVYGNTPPINGIIARGIWCKTSEDKINPPRIVLNGGTLFAKAFIEDDQNLGRGTSWGIDYSDSVSTGIVINNGVLKAIGATSAIYTRTNKATIIANGAIVTGANETFISGETTTLSQKNSFEPVTITVSNPEGAVVPVTGVKLNTSRVKLNQIGDVYQLEADVAPINATNQTVTWVSSNPGVAAVSDVGLVTAVSNGATTITATTQDGNYTATCEVIVELPEGPNVPVTGVELNTSRVELNQIGDVYQLEADVTPINATNQSVIWASSNPNIATVTDAGLVTAVSEGTATITVTTEDGKKVATCTVTVRIESGSGGTGGGGSSGSTTPAAYTITAGDTAGGTITINPKTSSKGQMVTITAVPDEGFTLETLFVTDKNGNKIDLTKKTETSYTFKMPASKVTVSATFTEIVVEPEPVVLPFEDISQSAWYYGAVEYVYSNNMMQGTSATTFSPEVEMSRGMIATVLYRLANIPTLTGSTPFSDVGGNEWYTDAIQWAAANNIMSGYGNNRFGPMDNVTREQLAVILYNYTTSEGISVEAAGDLSVFHDAEDTSDWAEEAISWAVGVGLLSGKGNGILDPTGTATRAEVAQMLMNYCMKVA